MANLGSAEMTSVFDNAYATSFLGEHAEVVESWEKSSDPVRSAVAALIKQTAGGITV